MDPIAIATGIAFGVSAGIAAHTVLYYDNNLNYSTNCAKKCDTVFGTAEENKYKPLELQEKYMQCIQKCASK